MQKFEQTLLEWTQENHQQDRLVFTVHMIMATTFIYFLFLKENLLDRWEKRTRPYSNEFNLPFSSSPSLIPGGPAGKLLLGLFSIQSHFLFILAQLAFLASCFSSLGCVVLLIEGKNRPTVNTILKSS